jgi:hypothetical protein
LIACLIAIHKRRATPARASPFDGLVDFLIQASLALGKLPPLRAVVQRLLLPL